MGCDGENKRTRRNNKTNGCLYDSWITLSTTRFCKESCEEGVAFHMACSNSASHDVIQFLYDAFPNAAHMTIWDDDDDGTLAAADKEVDAAALAAAVAAIGHEDLHPHCDIDGHALPIHYACEKNVSLSTIKLLVDEYPDCLTITDTAGNLPLHF